MLIEYNRFYAFVLPLFDCAAFAASRKLQKNVCWMHSVLFWFLDGESY